MFCIRCGANLPEDAAFCASCGAPITSGTAASAAVSPPPGAVSGPQAVVAAELPAARETRHYSGFWRRFWGHVIDRFILGVVFVPVSFMVLVPMLATESVGWTDTDLPAEAITALMGAVLAVAFFELLGSWLYNALLQSSSRQATLGQLALGVHVTDLEGRRVSFARASGRHFATVLTGLTVGIGYLIMLFTTRKQTLHDLIGGTVVVRTDPA